MAKQIMLKASSGYARDIANIPGISEIRFSVNGIEYKAPSLLYATTWLNEQKLYQPENDIVFHGI